MEIREEDAMDAPDEFIRELRSLAKLLDRIPPDYKAGGISGKQIVQAVNRFLEATKNYMDDMRQGMALSNNALRNAASLTLAARMILAIYRSHCPATAEFVRLYCQDNPDSLQDLEVLEQLRAFLEGYHSPDDDLPLSDE
jgi:hypothetical protein